MFDDDSEDEESSLDQLEQLEPPSEAEGKVGPLEVQYLLAKDFFRKHQLISFPADV